MSDRAGLPAPAGIETREPATSEALPEDRQDLAEKVAYLQHPDSYPRSPAAVEAIETHMAWVFLTEDCAYKLKKPVRYEYLDFSTLAARKRACEEELRLNRRLAPDVYLGVIPLNRTASGGLSLDGSGSVVDWLVQMRRLPRERMLDRMLEERRVTSGDIRRLGRLLADFYDDAPTADLSPAAYVRRLRRDLDANLAELRRPEFGLDGERIEGVGEALRGFLDGREDLLRRRVRAARVVEGHGDLRPEHVCLQEPPVIIDCIEFNPEFRTVDAADDLAFLQLECERLGTGQVGAAIVDAYCAESGDAPSGPLMRFYRAQRACLRAKLAAWHTVEAGRDDNDAWLGLAGEYLRRAIEHVGNLDP